MTYSFNLRVLGVFLLLIPLTVLFPATANGQTRPYTNTSLDYVLDLPSAKWHVI